MTGVPPPGAEDVTLKGVDPAEYTPAVNVQATVRVLTEVASGDEPVVLTVMARGIVMSFAIDPMPTVDLICNDILFTPCERPTQPGVGVIV